MKTRNPGLIISICLFALTIMVYSGVWHCGFIEYDDNSHVFANPHVSSGLTAENFKWAFTTFHASQWIPLTWVSYMGEITLFGFDPGVMHLTNVAFHAACVLLLFGMLWRMTGAMWQSAVVAMIFAVHPVNVESVAWIAERKNVLSTFFWFLTTWFYIDYVRKKRAVWMVLTAVCMALGLMSKAMLVTLPFTLLLFDVWPLKRTESWGKLVLEKVPLFVLTVAGSVIQLEAGRRSDLLASFEAAPLDYRVCSAIANYLLYAWNLAWPTKLSLIYPTSTEMPLAEAAISLLIFGSALWAGWRFRQKAPFILIGIFWYFGTMLPVGGLFRAGDVIFADRYSYIPQVGLLIAVVWSIGLLSSQKTKPVLVAVTVIAMCVMSWMTIQYVRYWVDGVALFTRCAEIYPQSFKLNASAGLALYRNEKMEEAIGYYQAALRVDPHSDNILILIGEAYSKQGKNKEAIAQFQKALMINPGSVRAAFNLATHLLEEKDSKTALKILGKLVEHDPRSSDAHYWMGKAFEMEGDSARAQQHYEKSIQLK